MHSRSATRLREVFKRKNFGGVIYTKSPTEVGLSLRAFEPEANMNQ